MAQSRPGTVVTFAAVDIDVAQRLHRAHHAALADIARSLEVVVDPPARPFWLLA